MASTAWTTTQPDMQDGSTSEGNSSASSSAVVGSASKLAAASIPAAPLRPLMRNDASTSASEQPGSSDSGPVPNSTTSSSSAFQKPKRKRITPVQLEALVAAFQTSDTPLYDVRERLASQLDMTNREVQVWFQNRRAKMARIRAQANAHNAESASVIPRKPATDFGLDSTTLSSSANDGHQEAPTQSVIESTGTPTSQSMDLDYNPESASSIISFSQDTPYQSYTIGRYGSVIQDAPPNETLLSARALPSRNSETLSWLSSVRSSTTTEGSGSSQWSNFDRPSPATTPSTQDPGLSNASNAYFSRQNHKFTATPGSSQGSSSPNAFFTGPVPVLPSPATNFLKLGSPSDNNDKPELPLPHLTPPTAPPGVTRPLPPAFALFGPAESRNEDSRSAQPPARQSTPNRSWHPNWANPIVPVGSSTYLPGLPRRTPQSDLEQYQRETPRKGV